jgi:hypothetical protein
MSDIVYVPIIKTGDAEIRAVENLNDDVKDDITPLFELTRSRKSKNVPRGDIIRRLNRLEEAYGNRQFIIDLTADPILANKQIEHLRDNRNGYRKWIAFLVSLKEDFPEIIPVIQISDENVKNEDDYYDRIKKQVGSLGGYFNLVAYRFPIEYDDFKGDLGAICQAISSDKIICVVDAEFITQEKSGIYSTKAIDVIKELEDFSLGNIALAATSVHRNPAEFGGKKEGELQLEECLFYDTVNSAVEAELVYGDYATINPIRILQAGGRGWIPRIDMPTEKTLFYYRSRKRQLEASYASAYTRVAKRMIKDKRYKKVKDKIDNCWGIEQIELAADAYPQGLSPSFWISVRMNIHITLRISLI